MGVRSRMLWAFRRWEAAQVDLNGQYSVARFSQLAAYSRQTPWWRVILRLLITPMPCVVILILIDSVHLEPTTSKPLESPVYWTRGYIVTLIMTIGILLQLRYHVPALPLSVRAVFGIAWLATTLGVASTMLWSELIGHPLPFSMLLGAPPWMTIQVTCIYWRARPLLRDHPTLKADLVAYGLFSQLRLSLTLVYPAYMFVFTSLEGPAQTAFVLVLSTIKFFAKNVMGRLLRDHDDLKPEALIFNVEIFHALFVSYSMQNATSIGTALVFMATDVLHGWIALVDVNRVISELHDHRRRMALTKDTQPFTAIETDLLSLTGTILEHNPQVRSHHTIRLTTWLSMSPLESVRSFARAAARRTSSIANSERPSSPPTSTVIHAHKPSVEHDVPGETAPWKQSYSSVVPLPQSKVSLSPRTASQSGDSVVMVCTTLKLLYVTEFIVLIEYVEIVVPFIFNTYMLAMFYLPNRAYYPLLKSMSDEQLRRSVVNVSMYALMEIASFVVISVALWQKLRFSVVHQLAFVLDQRWEIVQSAFVVWVVYVVQSSLEHIGFDYTFKFAWLHHDTGGA